MAKNTAQCAECGQPATVFVSFVQGGTVATKALCAEHTRAAGVDDPQGYALLESAAGPVLAAPARGESSLRCPVCDCSQRDFERHGRFGCPVCYTTFAGLLPDMLRRMHPGLEHRGKLPRHATDPAVTRRRLVRLQHDLDEAVRAGRYEGAAEARDAIAALKTQLPGPFASDSRPGERA